MTISKRTRWRGPSIWTAAACLAVSITGCQAISTIAILTMPNDVPAEYDELEGERVVVICNDVGGLGYQDAGVPTDLSRLVGARLQKKVSGIDVVNHDYVNDWIDSNDIHEDELGKAMDATKVVSIQLEHFGLTKGPNLYQGHAQITVQIHDVATGEVEELQPIESLYPPHAGVPLDQSEPVFRRRFLGVLANQVSRRFFAHESLEASKERLYPSE